MIEMTIEKEKKKKCWAEVLSKRQLDGMSVCTSFRVTQHSNSASATTLNTTTVEFPYHYNKNIIFYRQ